MAAQFQKVAIRLHNMILSGELRGGERIVETEFARKLAVSRTPLRLALSELEKEGLLERLPTRGFRVRVFTADEVSDAIDVRGCLEGMAARLAAERGVDDSTRANLCELVEEGNTIVLHDGPLDVFAWSDFNIRFHDALVDAACNGPLKAALHFNERVPLAGAGLIAFYDSVVDVTAEVVRRAQEDHAEVVNAVLRREGAKAEFLMRHHASRTRENRRSMVLRARAIQTADIEPKIGTGSF